MHMKRQATLSKNYKLILDNAKKGVINEVNAAFIEAAKAGELKAVKFWLKKGADVHYRNDYGLLVACDAGRLDVVKLLVERGLHIRQYTENCLFSAARGGHLEVVEYLVRRRADVRAQNDKALIDAAENGRLETVQYLEEQGANSLSIDRFSLCLIISYGHFHMARHLIDKIADMDAFIRYAHTNKSAFRNLSKFLDLREDKSIEDLWLFLCKTRRASDECKAFMKTTARVLRR